MFMHYVGGGVGHQDFIEVLRCNEEVDDMDTGADNQEVGDREGTSSDSESDDGESSNSNIDSEDIEEWDPDDEDMGLDIDNDYGDL